MTTQRPANTKQNPCLFILHFGISLDIRTFNFTDDRHGSCLKNVSGNFMRTCLTHILVLFFLSSLGQRKQSLEIWVEIGCGYEGTVSPEFDVIKSCIKNRDFSSLKSSLTTTNSVQKLLGAITINKMILAHSIVLTKEEHTYLRNIQRQTGYVTVCRGCTEVYRVRIKKFFRKTKLPGRLAIDEELKS